MAINAPMGYHNTAGVWLSRALIAAALATGCAGPDHIARGNRLLERGKYDEAVKAYEEAINERGANPEAEEGIKSARREAVRAELQKAKEKLNSGEYASALMHTLRAQRMPLDLDEVVLVRDIDETIAQASQRAEDSVETYSEQGLFVLAIEIAEQIVAASPGMESRARWAEGVRQRAIEYYTGLGRDLEKEGMLGAAAMQWAMAQKVGADVSADKVKSLWFTFTGPLCFADPEIEVRTETKLSSIKDPVVEAARAALAEAQARCGKGSRPLAVTISVEEGEVIDEENKVWAARPLPGSGVDTIETYYEEHPYTEVEEITVMEKRVEKVQRRDCAPRPGKPRGCVEWVEEVETEVPVKKTQEVRKVKRVAKTRPKKGPFPPDKVVTFEQTTITRRVAMKGNVVVEGAPTKPVAFEVLVESVDSSNPAVAHPRMPIKADAMAVQSMKDVQTQAGTELAKTIKGAMVAAVTAWSAKQLGDAKKRAMEGKLPKAEEIYLGLLALGVEENEDLRRFFRRRYGKPVGVTVDYLSRAMGVVVERRPPGENERVSRFPTRSSVQVEVAPTSVVVVEPKQIKQAPVVEEKPDVSAMDENELTALEEASMGEESGANPGAQADGVEEAPAGQDTGAGGGAGMDSAEKEPNEPKPVRGPVVPR